MFLETPQKTLNQSQFDPETTNTSQFPFTNFTNLTVKLPTIFHKIDDINKLSSQKKAERIRMIILTGSDAMVMRNRERAGP